MSLLHDIDTEHAVDVTRSHYGIRVHCGDITQDTARFMRAVEIAQTAMPNSRRWRVARNLCATATARAFSGYAAAA